MADQREIILRQGEATQKDVVLYPLPVADISFTEIYLYPGEIEPSSIMLRDPRATPAAGGDVSGTLAAILASALLSASGTLSVSGSFSSTLGDATLSATGSVAILGTLAPVLADAALSASGAIVVSGTIGAQLADDTLAAVGAVTVFGTLAAILGNDSLSAVGTVGDGEPEASGSDWLVRARRRKER